MKHLLLLITAWASLFFLGCSKCPDSLVQLHIDIDPLYQLYYSGSLEEAEEALLNVVNLALEYKECGLNSIPQLLVANYRLFFLNEYKGDGAMSEYYLGEAKKYYNLLGQPFIHKNDKSVEENLKIMFKEIEGQEVPKWKQNRLLRRD